MPGIDIRHDLIPVKTKKKKKKLFQSNRERKNDYFISFIRDVKIILHHENPRVINNQRVCTSFREFSLRYSGNSRDVTPLE